jgi:transposase
MAEQERVLTEELWHIMELSSQRESLGAPGRSMVPNGKALLGILYVLLNGIPWKALPKEYGSPSTC